MFYYFIGQYVSLLLNLDFLLKNRRLKLRYKAGGGINALVCKSMYSSFTLPPYIPTGQVGLKKDQHGTRVLGFCSSTVAHLSAGSTSVHLCVEQVNGVVHWENDCSYITTSSAVALLLFQRSSRYHHYRQYGVCCDYYVVVVSHCAEGPNGGGGLC